MKKDWHQYTREVRESHLAAMESGAINYLRARGIDTATLAVEVSVYEREREPSPAYRHDRKIAITPGAEMIAVFEQKAAFDRIMDAACPPSQDGGHKSAWERYVAAEDCPEDGA